MAAVSPHVNSSVGRLRADECAFPSISMLRVITCYDLKVFDTCVCCHRYSRRRRDVNLYQLAAGLVGRITLFASALAAAVFIRAAFARLSSLW